MAYNQDDDYLTFPVFTCLFLSHAQIAVGLRFEGRTGTYRMSWYLLVTGSLSRRQCEHWRLCLLQFQHCSTELCHCFFPLVCPQTYFSSVVFIHQFWASGKNNIFMNVRSQSRELSHMSPLLWLSPFMFLCCWLPRSYIFLIKEGWKFFKV